VHAHPKPQHVNMLVVVLGLLLVSQAWAEPVVKGVFEVGTPFSLSLLLHSPAHNSRHGRCSAVVSVMQTELHARGAPELAEQQLYCNRLQALCSSSSSSSWWSRNILNTPATAARQALSQHVGVASNSQEQDVHLFCMVLFLQCCCQHGASRLQQLCSCSCVAWMVCLQE
jgi:hypothetical protein